MYHCNKQMKTRRTSVYRRVLQCVVCSRVKHVFTKRGKNVCFTPGSATA